MGFGLFVGIAAAMITTFNVTSYIIKSEIRMLYKMQTAHQAEVERLQGKIRELKLEREKERAEAEQKLFEGGVIAAAIAGMAVVGPAVVEAVKQMR
jgi:hypothetical protein